MTTPRPPLRRPLPVSTADIARIQSEGRRRAVAQAQRAPFYKGKLDHVDSARLDDPAEWARLPILDKDQLRALTDAQFYSDFCLPAKDISEFWRSGGSTGRPLFYPRNREDMRHAMTGFGRLYDCLGLPPGTRIHCSFPLGIHPVGQMLARAAQTWDLAVNWAGAGTTTPSALQLELIDRLGAQAWMGMSSYGLHLANLADAQGIDLAAKSVRSILCSAEPLSDAKREKLERAWGATVRDTFGMTEAGMMGCEDRDGPGLGFRVWTDLYHVEVLDQTTLAPVPNGQVGVLVVTPLFTNNVTPFLRWNSGDLVTLTPPQPDTRNPFSVFPLVKHAHRTVGFFKVRGVNLNHAEFEDFVFANAAINDFKAEALAADGNDVFKVSIEVKRGADAGAVAATLKNSVKQRFELTPEVELLPTGTLAREFEAAIKAPRFVDRR
ncbi:MAG: AMP-binding protein [Burkholderiales bacterium]|nr:AMP-binding protein [Burkholderiales bacterium]